MYNPTTSKQILNILVNFHLSTSMKIVYEKNFIFLLKKILLQVSQNAEL
jgi:hypothetical protein